MGSDQEKEAKKKAKAEVKMMKKSPDASPPLPDSELPTVVERPLPMVELPTVVTRDLPPEKPWHKDPNRIKAIVGILALAVAVVGLLLTKTNC